jgi:hypothetical protein
VVHEYRKHCIVSEKERKCGEAVLSWFWKLVPVFAMTMREGRKYLENDVGGVAKRWTVD